MNKNGDQTYKIINVGLEAPEDEFSLKIGSFVQIIDGTHKGKHAKILKFEDI